MTIRSRRGNTVGRTLHINRQGRRTHVSQEAHASRFYVAREAHGRIIARIEPADSQSSRIVDASVVSIGGPAQRSRPDARRVEILTPEEQAVAETLRPVGISEEARQAFGEYQRTKAERIGRQAVRQLAPLTAAHQREGFRCGEPELDRFLREEAHREVSGSTWVLVDDIAPHEILAYLTFVPDPAELMDPDSGFEGQETVLVKCLAVREDLQGEGIGFALMFHAIEQVVSASAYQPLKRMVFDPINEAMRRRILERWALPAQDLRPGSQRMMLTIEDMRALVEP